MPEIQINDLMLGDVLLLKGLMEDGKVSISHTGIALGQAIMTHRLSCSSKVIHAVLYAGDGEALEAAGGDTKRVVRSKFEKREQADHNFEYLVYRTADPARIVAVEMATKMAELAKDQNYDTFACITSVFRLSFKGPGYQKRKNATKALASAIIRTTPNSEWDIIHPQSSLEDILDLPGLRNTWYCSSFVVFVYELARHVLAEQLNGSYHNQSLFSGVDFGVVSPKLLHSSVSRSGDWRHVGNVIARTERPETIDSRAYYDAR